MHRAYLDSSSVYLTFALPGQPNTTQRARSASISDHRSTPSSSSATTNLPSTEPSTILREATHAHTAVELSGTLPCFYHSCFLVVLLMLMDWLAVADSVYERVLRSSHAYDAARSKRSSVYPKNRVYLLESRIPVCASVLATTIRGPSNTEDSSAAIGCIRYNRRVPNEEISIQFDLTVGIRYRYFLHLKRHTFAPASFRLT